MSMIAIEGMEFYSYHGCFKEEKEIGTHFIVDFYCSKLNLVIEID